MTRKRFRFTITIDKPIKVRKRMSKPTIAFKNKINYNRKNNKRILKREINND